MSRIEQIISEIEEYVDGCKCKPFSNNVIMCDKDTLQDMLAELRLKVPDEVKKYQRILNNKDAIIADAKEQAEAIINAAQIQTEELINEHQIMQQAYAQANDLIEQATAQAQRTIDNATEEANSIRIGAMEYTDEMLVRLQHIIEHSLNDNRIKFESLIGGLQGVLDVVENNRRELNQDSDDEVAEDVTEEVADAIEEDDDYDAADFDELDDDDKDTDL